MYDTFDGTEFHVHLATSTDLGLTFTDQDLYDFTATGISFPYQGGNRILGDYQFLTAVGNNVYGTFAGRGNVNDPKTGINTTGYMDPFFFTATAPTVGDPAIASALNTAQASTTVSATPATVSLSAGVVLSNGGATANIAGPQGLESNGQTALLPADQLLTLLGNNLGVNATQTALTDLVNEVSSLDSALLARFDALLSMGFDAYTLQAVQEDWLRDLLIASL